MAWSTIGEKEACRIKEKALCRKSKWWTLLIWKSFLLQKREPVRKARVRLAKFHKTRKTVIEWKLYVQAQQNKRVETVQRRMWWKPWERKPKKLENVGDGAQSIINGVGTFGLYQSPQWQDTAWLQQAMDLYLWRKPLMKAQQLSVSALSQAESYYEVQAQNHFLCTFLIRNLYRIKVYLSEQSDLFVRDMT